MFWITQTKEQWGTEMVRSKTVRTSVWEKFESRKY